MSEAFGYIEREYKDAKGRVELQRWTAPRFDRTGSVAR